MITEAEFRWQPDQPWRRITADEAEKRWGHLVGRPAFRHVETHEALIVHFPGRFNFERKPAPHFERAGRRMRMATLAAVALTLAATPAKADPKNYFYPSPDNPFWQGNPIVNQYQWNTTEPRRYYHDGWIKRNGRNFENPHEEYGVDVEEK